MFHHLDVSARCGWTDTGLGGGRITLGTATEPGESYLPLQRPEKRPRIR